MKKTAATMFAMLALVGFGGAFAQSSAAHDVEVKIPDLLMLRITDGSSNAAATNPAVNFDFVSDWATYMNAIDAGGSAPLAPTSTTNFGDIIVLSSRALWRVDVVSTLFVFTADVVAGQAAAGLDLDDVTVVPSGTKGTNVTTVAASFNLSTTSSPIANGQRTQGWRSLGISGSDYSLTVDGDEAPGTYVATVTYSIAAP